MFYSHAFTFDGKLGEADLTVLGILGAESCNFAYGESNRVGFTAPDKDAVAGSLCRSNLTYTGNHVGITQISVGREGEHHCSEFFASYGDGVVGIETYGSCTFIVDGSA